MHYANFHVPCNIQARCSRGRSFNVYETVKRSWLSQCSLFSFVRVVICRSLSYSFKFLKCKRSKGCNSHLLLNSWLRVSLLMTIPRRPHGQSLRRMHRKRAKIHFLIPSEAFCARSILWKQLQGRFRIPCRHGEIYRSKFRFIICKGPVLFTLTGI